MTEISKKLPLKTKILYGFGSAAYGIKDNGFSVFLLFYYNQVIGMRADVVSLAIAIALFVDALIDPLIGQMTDRTRTPIGSVAVAMASARGERHGTICLSSDNGDARADLAVCL